jgi:hypothetical protein
MGKCKTPFDDIALGEQCSRRLASAYPGVTMVRDSCVGLQTITSEGSAVIRTENDEFQLKSYYLSC